MLWYQRLQQLTGYLRTATAILQSLPRTCSCCILNYEANSSDRATADTLPDGVRRWARFQKWFSVSFESRSQEQLSFKTRQHQPKTKSSKTTWIEPLLCRFISADHDAQTESANSNGGIFNYRSVKRSIVALSGGAGINSDAFQCVSVNQSPLRILSLSWKQPRFITYYDERTTVFEPKNGDMEPKFGIKFATGMPDDCFQN